MERFLNRLGAGSHPVCPAPQDGKEEKARRSPDQTQDRRLETYRLRRPDLHRPLTPVREDDHRRSKVLALHDRSWNLLLVRQESLELRWLTEGHDVHQLFRRLNIHFLDKPTGDFHGCQGSTWPD